MPTVIHMQSTAKRWDDSGVPLHRTSKWNFRNGGADQFVTTLDPKKVTCKTCKLMLSNQK